MWEVVGDRTADEVITIDRQEIETEALTKMQTLSTKYAMGISIDQVQWKTSRRRSPSPGSRARVAATRGGSWDQGPMGTPHPLDYSLSMRRSVRRKGRDRRTRLHRAADVIHH
jgi:hypothetical protein